MSWANSSHEQHPERRYYVEEPTLLIVGCQPLVPYHGWDTTDPKNFHAPADVRDAPRGDRQESADRITRIERDALKSNRPAFDGYSWPQGGKCPACRGQLSRYPRETHPFVDRTYADRAEALPHRSACLLCDGMTPENEQRAEALRRNREIERLSSTREIDQEKIVAKQLEAIQSAGVVFTEAERRRIYFGCRGDHLALPEEMASRVKLARAFLAKIGQLPNPRIILGRNGEVIGEYADEIELSDESIMLATGDEEGDPIPDSEQSFLDE